MKKTRRLLALVLAMMMALGCMAMPAMAAHEDDHDCAVCSAEGIEPRVRVTTCPECGAAAYMYTAPDGHGGTIKWVECSSCNWSSI